MAQGTWTSIRWVDPDSGSEHPAIVTPIEFGPDGDVTMSYRMDTGAEVNGFSSWTRGEAGTTVRFAGTDAEAEAAQAENRLLVAVLESQGLADALAGLPCGAG